MRPENIRELRNAQRFVPFRIWLVDGKTRDVSRRDFEMIARSVIDISVNADLRSYICDRIVRVAPLHIVRIENRQAAA